MHADKDICIGTANITLPRAQRETELGLSTEYAPDKMLSTRRRGGCVP